MRTAANPDSKVRYVVVFVTFLAALLLYLDRFCISYVQLYIKEDLGLSNDQLGWCYSAFFIAYALAQVPSGWLSDRFGARWMLPIFILAWSAFTALMGFSVGFVMLLILRAAVGISQAGAYPTSAALLGRWIPFSARGKANSCVAFGGRLGGFIAPLLTVYLVILFVPTDVPSDLTPDDLLDVRRLCQQMVEADKGVPAGNEPELTARRNVRAAVFYQLSDEGQQAAARLAAKDQAAFPADIQTIQADLNRLLGNESIAGEADLASIPSEREAELLAAKTDRSDAETHRLNRLRLEAVFPESIRKLYVHGWRQVTFVYGFAGLFVAGLFWLSFRERPAEHPWCNAAERKRIESDRPAAARGDHGRLGGVPIKAMLRSRSLWLMCVNQFGGNVGWVFLMTWLPRYLWEVHTVPFVERGWMAAIPLSVGWLGMLLGGWLTDRLTGRFGLRWRTAPIVLGRFIAAAAYLSCLIAPSAWAATAAFALIAFSNDACNPASWSYKQDVGGRYVGAIHGWANMFGNFGAALSPVLLQLVISQFGWNAAFITGATAFVMAGTAALGVDARIPIVAVKDAGGSATRESSCDQ